LVGAGTARGAAARTRGAGEAPGGAAQTARLPWLILERTWGTCRTGLRSGGAVTARGAELSQSVRPWREHRKDEHPETQCPSSCSHVCALPMIPAQLTRGRPAYSGGPHYGGAHDAPSMKFAVVLLSTIRPLAPQPTPTRTRAGLPWEPHSGRAGSRASGTHSGASGLRLLYEMSLQLRGRWPLMSSICARSAGVLGGPGVSAGLIKCIVHRGDPDQRTTMPSVASHMEAPGRDAYSTRLRCPRSTPRPFRRSLPSRCAPEAAGTRAPSRPWAVSRAGRG
jgi:hypothetical protein